MVVWGVLHGRDMCGVCPASLGWANLTHPFTLSGGNRAGIKEAAFGWHKPTDTVGVQGGGPLEGLFFCPCMEMWCSRQGKITIYKTPTKDPLTATIKD